MLYDTPKNVKQNTMQTSKKCVCKGKKEGIYLDKYIFLIYNRENLIAGVG